MYILYRLLDLISIKHKTIEIEQRVKIKSTYYPLGYRKQLKNE